MSLFQNFQNLLILPTHLDLQHGLTLINGGEGGIIFCIAYNRNSLTVAEHISKWTNRWQVDIQIFSVIFYNLQGIYIVSYGLDQF